MKKYIEQEVVLDIVTEWCPDDDGSVGKTGDLRNMLDELEAIPTADVVEVRHGRWIPTKATHIQKGAIYSRCSICNEYVAVLGNKLRYCPNCGAKMDGGINNG